ncbi:amidohydrolase family protein [Legionella tunisiensis]|uniref:amidohydrolase family protein n=1 Tax=Legionella tunisiensis TaxID=1034944 RepID=UPI0003673FDE|nr:amidohydrolase family protein [Legionella tunisiensis]
MPKVSIDHLGLTTDGLNHLYQLVEHGIHVKATGFMRVDFDPLTVMKQINHINPNALMFGTDLPGTRAKRQFNQNDLILIEDNFTASDCKRIFCDNALEFYRLK